MKKTLQKQVRDIMPPFSLAGRKILFQEENLGNLYFVEDMGANTLGVNYKSKRMKRPEYIGTAGSIEGAQRHIWRHKMEKKHGPAPTPQGAVSIMSLGRLADEYYRELEEKEAK